MGKILVVCACLSVAAWADPAASQPIETNSFRYVPPAGWVVNLTTRPVSIVGPAKELLQLTTKNVSGAGTDAEAKGILKDVEGAGVRSIERVIKEDNLRLVRPASRRLLPNGAAITELEARSQDGMRTLLGFVIVGPRSVLLATLDASGNAQTAISAIRQSFEAIRWTQ